MDKQTNNAQEIIKIRKTRSDKMTPEEKRISNDEKTKRYYMKNQEKVKEQKRISSLNYYNENKEVCKDGMKNYYQNKKEATAEATAEATVNISYSFL